MRWSAAALALTMPLPTQLEAGREIPPPPDYDGMLAELRSEVAENFTAPKDATKTKKTKSRSEGAADADWEEEASDSDDAEAEDAENAEE